MYGELAARPDPTFRPTNLYLMRTLIACLLLVSLATSVHSQIAFGGTPIGTKAEKRGLPKPQRQTFQAVDREALLAEDAANAALGIKGPFRFGVNHTTDLTMENSGTWNELEDGTRLWRLELLCQEALAVNFEFSEYQVPTGAFVFVYNPSGEVLGGFTQASSGGLGHMGVGQLSGDRITVEYLQPADILGQGHLRISQVTHAYRAVPTSAKGLGDSGACNNNTICPEGDPWQNEISSVAMIVVGGNGYCTGSLINNCAQDGTPYFLTANHCTQGQNTGNWVFRFNWESPTCAPTTNGPTNQTVSGATLLVNSPGSDVALLELNTVPPANYGVYYAGWDATGTAPTSTTCVHHPSGDIKKISFDENPATTGTFGGAECWHISAWDDGTTEGGSSGSGLWNQEHRIVGQLFGGEANCSNNVNDYFGKFSVSFPLLDEYLGACGQVLDGYDPNVPQEGLDASIQSITGIEETYCGTGTIEPSITIKCVGTETLTQLTYAYDLDGGASTTADWTGSLTQGQTATIALGPISVSNGSHVFHASCSAPNGDSDQNPVNDSKERSFQVSNPAIFYTLTITLDDYGSETTWDFVPQGSSSSVASGGPYQDDLSGTVIQEQICLGEGCYTLTMHDAYGDGMCCEFGDGDFTLEDGSGTVVFDGNGAFTDETSTEICATVGITEGWASSGPVIRPNPGTGPFSIDAGPGFGTMSARILDATGREVWRSVALITAHATVDPGQLPGGTYTVLMTGQAGARAAVRLVVAH